MSVSGAGDPSDITSLTLLANGLPIATTTVSGTTATLSFSGNISASSSVTYRVVVNFGTNASGTYSFSVTGASGNNGQAVQFSGLSVAGATITVSHPTSTPTSSPTVTVTATPADNTVVLVYPNPATGSSVNVLAPAYSGSEDVRVEIFTLGFRKVLDEPFQDVPAGKPVTVQLKDQWGTPLANGLYYVMVTVDGKHSTAKLLILR